jgi:hypothetical protein
LRRLAEAVAARHLAPSAIPTPDACSKPTAASRQQSSKPSFGFRRHDHYRIHVLLYAGRPNWELLDTITPR